MLRYSELKRGDVVICIHKGACHEMVKGKTYKVVEVDIDRGVLLEGLESHWLSPIFELVPPVFDCRLNRELYPELKPDGKGNLV